MKITVSKRKKLRFVPQLVDEEATERAREEAPPEERDVVEPVMKDADYALYFWPLTLQQEEDIIAMSGRATDGRMAVFTSAGVINSIFARQVCGWEGILGDDDQPLPFETKWDAGKLPDQIVQHFKYMEVRVAAFAFLVEQAGARGESVVGKSE